MKARHFNGDFKRQFVGYYLAIYDLKAGGRRCNNYTGRQKKKSEARTLLRDFS